MRAHKLRHLRSCLRSCCSVAQSCPTLCDPMDCSTPGFPVLTTSQSLLKLMSTEPVMPSNHFILCHPLLLLPSIFPSNRIFSNELVLCIRWPKYWSFSFSISPSNEYSGLISFRMDWLDLLAGQGTLKGLLQHHSSKASILWHLAFFMVQLSHPYMTTRKTIDLTIRTSVSKELKLSGTFSACSLLPVSSWSSFRIKKIHISTSWCQDPCSDLCVRTGPQPDLSSPMHFHPVLRTNVIWGRWSVPSSRPTCWSVRWPHCCSGSPQTSRSPLLLCWSYRLGSGLLCPWVYLALGDSLSSCSTCSLGTRPRVLSPPRWPLSASVSRLHLPSWWHPLTFRAVRATLTFLN